MATARASDFYHYPDISMCHKFRFNCNNFENILIEDLHKEASSGAEKQAKVLQYMTNNIVLPFIWLLGPFDWIMSLVWSVYTWLSTNLYEDTRNQQINFEEPIKVLFLILFFYHLLTNIGSFSYHNLFPFTQTIKVMSFSFTAHF